MSRTVDPKRPRELRARIARYLIKHGLTNLSLRPLAKAVGTSPRVLLYYFGSKEKMIMEVLAELRERQRAVYGEVTAPTFGEECQIIWKQMSSPESEPQFRLFFEIYGIALREPELYKDFLHDTVENWLQLIEGGLLRDGYTRAEARAFATIVIAGLRGFMLDYCTTHDRSRLDRAISAWLAGLDAMLASSKRGKKK